MSENIGKDLFLSLSPETIEEVAHAITGENYDVIEAEVEEVAGTALHKIQLEDEDELVQGATQALVKAGTLAGYASAESLTIREKMLSQYQNISKDAIVSTGGIPREFDFDLTGENFSSVSPNEVASVHFDANLKLGRQNAFAEAIFPTLVQPVGTVIYEVTLTVTAAIRPFLRDGSKVKDRWTPLTYDINDIEGIFNTNGNRVYPVVGIKDEFDAYLDTDVKSEVKDPVSGQNIETAPILVNQRVPLLDISQSAAELAGGVADDKTTLAPGAKIESIHIDVNGERYALDATGLRDAIFYGTPNGDDLMDLQLLSDNEMSIKLSELLQEDGTAGTEFDGSDGITYVYDTRLSGSGSTVEKELVVDVNEFKLIKMVRADGTEVVDTDPDYADLKDIGDKITKEAVISVTLEAYITNEDMRRNGLEITSSIKAEKHVLKPFTAITVVTPAKGLAGKYSDRQLIDSMAEIVTPIINVDAVATLLSAAKVAAAMTGNGTFATKFKSGIASHVIKPTYIKEDLDLTNAVNNWASSQKDDDIAGTIISTMKNVLARLNTQSNLADYRELVMGRPNDFIVAVGSNVAAFLPKTIKIEDYNLKVVSSRFKQMQNKVFLIPGNLQSDRNTRHDYTSFGAFVMTPILLGESPVDGKVKYTAHPVGKHIVTNYVIGEINISGLSLDGVLGKQVYDTHAV